jgi:ribosomal subunit interface protein
MINEFAVEVTIRGNVGGADRRYAEDKVTRLARFAPRPILYARATLSEASNPAVERRAVAEATLDVSGRVVRAHVAARQMREAVDLLEERLRRRLQELAENYASRRREDGIAEPGEWRHGDLPTARPDFFPRPIDERELVVHKTFADGPATPEEAALDMRLLDFDFYLFTNAATREDNLLYRREGGGLGWIQQTPGADDGARYAIDLRSDPVPVPAIAVAEAIERLDAGGEPFVFFTSRDTGRGNVLYRRYDGHYGLITPPDRQ